MTQCVLGIDNGGTVAKDGKIYLSMLNLQVPAGAAVWTIDTDNQLQKLIDLPYDGNEPDKPDSLTVVQLELLDESN